MKKVKWPPKGVKWPPPFRNWTEGEWLARERAQRKKEDAKKPLCPVCNTYPAEEHGFEETFCECGRTHYVDTRRPENENIAARRAKSWQK